MPTLFHMKSTFSSRTIKGFHKTPYIIFFSQDCKNKGKSLYFSKRKKIQFHKFAFRLEEDKKKVIRCEICNCIFFFVSLWSSNCGSKWLANKFVMIKKGRLPNGEKKIRNKPCSNLKPSFITSETTEWKKHRSKVLI